MSRGDAEMTLQKLKELMRDFRVQRGWDKHMTPKNIAISISLEAAELLEHFQWDEYKDADKQAIADELADIVITCVSFADVMGIDIASSCLSKIERIKQKYPVELFNPDSANNDEYFRIKKTYRQKKEGS